MFVKVVDVLKNPGFLQDIHCSFLPNNLCIFFGYQQTKERKRLFTDKSRCRGGQEFILCMIHIGYLAGKKKINIYRNKWKQLSLRYQLCQTDVPSIRKLVRSNFFFFSSRKGFPLVGSLSAKLVPVSSLHPKARGDVGVCALARWLWLSTLWPWVLPPCTQLSLSYLW